MLLPENFIERIEEIADRDMVSKSDVLRKAIARYLENDPKVD